MEAILKNTVWCLALISIVFSCVKSKDVAPGSFIQIGKDSYKLNYGFYKDFGVDDREYNIEFAMSNLNLRGLNNCNGRCEAYLLFIDLYADKPVYNQKTFKINPGYPYSIKDGYGEMYMEIQHQDGSDKYIRFGLGSLELNGSNPSNLTFKFSGLTGDGEKVIGQFKGSFTETEL